MTVILYHMTTLARITPDDDTAVLAASVAALPALPATDPTERYGVRRLTAAWLADFAPTTRTGYFRDLADFLAWCQRDNLDPLTARSTDLGQYRASLEHAPPGHPPLSPATVHRCLSALSSWYNYLVANGDGVPRANPVTGIRRPHVDRDASTTAGLTTDEVRALLHAADSQLRLRAGELRRDPTPRRRSR